MISATISPITATPIRAGIYCRLSQDKAGDMLAVTRQEKAARALCKRNGWAVVELFVDDDISAYSGKHRPAYHRMLEAVANRSIDAVVAYNLDRLHRLPMELEHFFNVCDTAGVTTMATCEGDVSLGTSEGQLYARIMGAMAKKSSDDTSRRLKAKYDELAEAGQPRGGTVPFGYADAMTLDPATAVIFRSMAAAILAGETATGVAKTLNAAGVPTSRGKGSWSAQQVTQVLIRPGAAGLRQHRGVVVGPATWPALIDADTHERLKARLAPRPGWTPRTKSLWTGFLRCGGCGVNLVRNNHGRHLQAWTCRKFEGRESGHRCGCSVEVGLLDAVMIPVLMAQLRNVATPAATPGDDAVALVAALEAEAVEWGEDAGAGRCSKATAMAAIKGISERIATARLAAVRQMGAAALIDFTMASGEVDAKFAALTLDRQRAVVAAVIDAVIVAPGPSSRDVEGRITVKWRDQP